MAVGYLSKPGTEYGPCETPCTHVDCGATRIMAHEVCRICQDEIGYERDFYVDPEVTRTHQMRYVHASCLE